MGMNLEKYAMKFQENEYDAMQTIEHISGKVEQVNTMLGLIGCTEDDSNTIRQKLSERFQGDDEKAPAPSTTKSDAPYGNLNYDTRQSKTYTRAENEARALEAIF